MHVLKMFPNFPRVCFAGSRFEIVFSLPGGEERERGSYAHAASDLKHQARIFIALERASSGWVGVDVSRGRDFQRVRFANEPNPPRGPDDAGCRGGKGRTTINGSSPANIWTVRACRPMSYVTSFGARISA